MPRGAAGVAVIATVVTGLTAGCGRSPSGHGSTGPSGTPDTAVDLQVPVHPLPTDSAALPALGTSGSPQDLLVSDWSLVARAPDDRSLLIRVPAGDSCARRVGVAFDDEPGSVVIRPLYQAQSAPPSRCPAVLVLERVIVVLPSPLGPRQLRRPERVTFGPRDF